MNKALFWDFAGTLANGSSWSRTLHGAMTRFGYAAVTTEEIREHNRTGFSWHTPEISYAGDTADMWWDKLFAHWKILYRRHNVGAGDAEKLNAYMRSYFSDVNDYSLYPGAVETLRKCAELGYTNHLLSNNFPELPDIVEKLGLNEYFGSILVSANVGYEKPRREIFDFSLRLSGFPDVRYMIGDNPVADIAGGRNAGMRTVLVHNDADCGADFVCEILAEIPYLLE